MILSGNLHQKHEKELREDKFIYLLGTKAPTRLNIVLKHYGRELYEAIADLTAQNTEPFFNLPVKTFSVDKPFPMHFLNISALGNWMKFLYFT